MASLLSLSPPPQYSTSRPCVLPANTPFSHPLTKNPSRKYHQKVQSTKFASFLDFEPESKPEPLDFDIPWFNPTDRAQFDVIVIGAGPAGLRLADQVSSFGIKVCCVDPSPLSMWPNNYGVWADEFESLGLDDCLDKIWPIASIFIDDEKKMYLERAYGRVNRKELKLKFLSHCVTNGVKFHKAKAMKINHVEFESSVVCDDGTVLKASLIVDASGYTNFLEYDKPRNLSFQLSHGILAEVDSHPFDLDKMHLMDWRDSHLSNEPSLRASNSKLPTFFYAMPFDSNLVFLEETALVNRPIQSYTELKNRMVARLRHLGIRVRSVIGGKKCVIPMGGALPKIPQSLMAIGGNSGIENPTSGYTLARTMAVAPVVAQVIAECLGSTEMVRGSTLHSRVWNALWPLEKRFCREFYNFGMETLLQLDLDGTRRLFDAFFKIDPYYYRGFMSSTLSIDELFVVGFSLFWHASNDTKLEMATKSPANIAIMMANMALEAIV